MAVLGGIASLGGAVACCGTLFVLLLVALVFWYWRHQPNMQVTSEAPEPPIQAKIEHPTAETPAAPSAPEPTVEPPVPSDAEPPSAPSADA